jgi:hypothetical protein
MIFGIEIVVEGDCSGSVQKVKGRADVATDWRFDDELFDVARLMSLRRAFVVGGITMMRKKMKVAGFCRYLVG